MKSISKGYWQCILMVCLVFVGCIPENIELPSRVKSVTTNEPARITVNSATLCANVNLVDSNTINCGIIYDISSKLSSSIGTKKNTTANGDYSVNLSGLKPNTTYYYRAYAVDAEVYKYGDICSFKTDISVTTTKATDITYNSAILGGSVVSGGQTLTCGVIYGTSSTLSSSNGTMKTTESSGSYSITVSELNPNTTYYYCAYAVIDGEYKYGEVCTFNTLMEVTVTTGTATDITENSVILSATINNSEKSLACGVIYGTSSSLSSSSGTKKSTTSSGTFSVSLTGLNPNMTYYYRAYVVVDGEYKYGDVLSFTTIKEVTVSTGSATNVTHNGATLSGTINNSDKSLTCGIIYGTSSSLSSSSGTKKSTTSSGTFSVSLTGLNPNTTYYYRAYAVVDGEYKYGDVLSFTTKSTPKPQVVDLGLSVKWASFNIGATSPEDYGGYYAWGETEEKSNYSWSTYKWCNGSYDTMTKYCKSSSYGTVDNKKTLELSDDVAHVKLGGSWRMPTLDEIKELINDCSWSWTTQNGVNGYKVTGPNGNSIFLPAAGYRIGTRVDFRGSDGFYWSGTLGDAYSYFAYYLNIYSSSRGWYDNGRVIGHTVRPVTD